MGGGTLEYDSKLIQPEKSTGSYAILRSTLLLLNDNHAIQYKKCTIKKASFT